MPAEEGRSNTNGYTEDGTVDLKGEPVLRSKRGGWKACSFIVVYPGLERMAYYGISTNLMGYLKNKLHQGTVTASIIVTTWEGSNWVASIFSGYIANAHLGHYWTFIISSIVYLSGMCLLTLSVSLPSLKPPECLEMDSANCKKATTLQLAVFYGALYTVAVGAGGTMPNISTIGAAQFDDYSPKEKAHKLSFFNWWMFSIFFGTLFANTALVYIQDNVNWTLGYGLPTLGFAISIAIFLAGTLFYRHKVPIGSPFTRMAKVMVAAVRKWRVPFPNDPTELYELDVEEYAKNGKHRINSTPTLRFLDKACVKTGSSTSSWMLCTVTQVEETKQVLRLIPILVATFVPSMMTALVNTLFVKQAATLDRSIGNFKIPPASLVAFVTLSMLICIIFYDRFFLKIMQKLTKNPRGITLLQRMGIGLIIHMMLMTIASLTEKYRLHVAKQHGVVANGGTVPLTIFAFLPQFVLMGIADSFLEVAKIEFFYDQAPEGMKSLGTSCPQTTLGIGKFLSAAILTLVSHITEEHGKRGWILNNLNESHLDYYYALLAGLNLLNFILFFIFARFYVYKAEISDSMPDLGRRTEGEVREGDN